MKTRIKEQLLADCNLHTIVRLPNGVFSPYTGIKTNLLFFTKGSPTKDIWYFEHPYPPGYKSYSKTKPIRIEVMKTKEMNKRKKVEEWVFNPEGPKPKSVAIIHCVGSRDAHYNRYCSRVCCMYSLKFAHLVREKLPDAACYEFYIDMRAFGKGYEEFFERIKHEEVFVMRGRSAGVGERDGQMFVKGE